MPDPKIAVLIPAHNEELTIGGTIEALLAADQDRRDIYIVNDQSTDSTIKIAKSYGVHVYSTPINCGKALAQSAALSSVLSNFGILERYEWVIFLDGDTKVDIRFIDEMYAAAKNDPTVALYVGQVKSVKDKHIFSAVRAVDYAYGQDLFKQGQSNFNAVYVSPGCSSMYRTDILQRLTIDHLTLAEDMDLTIQVHRLGEKVAFLPQAFVNTQDPATLADYTKQMLRWYRGFWQVVIKHRIFGFTKKQSVDVYMIMAALDSLIMNRGFWYFGMAALNPAMLPLTFGIDLVLSFLVVCWGGYRAKRADVLYKFPLIYLVSYVSLYAYVRAFVEIIVLRKEILAWNKVKRYSF